MSFILIIILAIQVYALLSRLNYEAQLDNDEDEEIEHSVINPEMTIIITNPNSIQSKLPVQPMPIHIPTSNNPFFSKPNYQKLNT
ncbi:hypothetical protein CONCODRAFT_18348 [Conidiobolus coronatus NRRL 28638]|uniref:Secreted protein n=1 Tax=Conidiobolus coronatus (strain ATCC 28846 / CBS 209.66 / NRRL 28638) TaxID=796925 RepID=A0A137P3C8_CONC2|nr:hypothetical protein CONCODRAFT_18348 [Conidiobolus coronatus NRRL 28638]|eukprot:KXN69404.1 hypothetical protein CONCODRAFT_18348 [Conidiobolus coronatus NRRL 28638]